MRRIVLTVALILTIGAGRAAADGVTPGVNEQAFAAAGSESEAGHSANTDSAASGSTSGNEEAFACAGSHLSGCDGTAVCDNGTMKVVTYLVTESGSSSYMRDNCPTTTTLTVDRIRSAFKRIPVRASPLHIQPPHGETLVNFDSIFYTTPTIIDRRLKLLGSTVDFHITVARYTWHYGDGHTTQTADPGAAYPHQTITHRYLRKGTVSVSLDTTYQADYRTNGGPQQHLTDTVTVVGAAQRLDVLTATPHLVGD